MLYDSFNSVKHVNLEAYEEVLGSGIQASFKTRTIRIGAPNFVGYSSEKPLFETAIHVCINDVYYGKYVFKNAYRKYMKRLFFELKNSFELSILSGDNEGEKEYLATHLPQKVHYLFDQRPDDKLAYIKSLQNEGKKVMMIGDGLNDAGALAQSDVGISLSENINVFSPACDAILDATKFKNIATYIALSKKAIKIIKYSFVLSLCYNAIGLYFAVTGQLEPVIAAILMPLSSITIVVFTTIMTNLLGKKIKN